MKPVLVTGATGFVGWHVAQALIAAGKRVRALVRGESRMKQLDAETAVGDLRDADSLERAVQGCCEVYHVAADYRLWTRDPEEMYRSNVDGTRNVLEAARKAGVERFVYTSTVGCIGVPENGTGSEEKPVTLEEMAGPYKRSKFLAEQVALRFAAERFPVIIVNPTAPIGDHDFKPTPTGKIILDFIRGEMPAYIDTGLNFVDVRDVARGHLLAAERGSPGERYILGCENLTLREVFQRLSRISGRPAPFLQIPYAVAYSVAAVNTGVSMVTGHPPRAPLDGVRMAKKKMFVVHDKAARELSYAPGDVNGALARAVEWFRASGYC